MVPGPLLLTGARGWLGSRLAERLAGEVDGELHALGRQDLDLADEVHVRRTVEEIRPLQVVHLAASLRRGEEPESQAAQWRDTFAAGRNLLQAAGRVPVQHLVMAGSMEELGDRADVLEPEAPARPVTTYGLCKSLVREVASFSARRGEQTRVDWFRPTTVYGPGQRGPMLVAYACAAARRGEPAGFTDGAQRRDFLYVDDLVDWLMLALDARVAEHGERGFFLHHLGTGVSVPVREVLERIEAEMPGARFRLGAVPRRAHEPLVQTVPEYHDDNRVLRSWRAGTGLAEGIARTVAWWKDQPA